MSAAQSAADLQVSGAVPETRATVPLPAAMAIVPVASAVGSATVPPVPAACATSLMSAAARDQEPDSSATCRRDPADGLPARYSDAGAQPCLAADRQPAAVVADELDEVGVAADAASRRRRDRPRTPHTSHGLGAVKADGRRFLRSRAGTGCHRGRAAATPPAGQHDGTGSGHHLQVRTMARSAAQPGTDR
ncbi:hypothetical protein SBADM41S_12358 [Streptomyces badius]